jgi:hypothetical protein
LLARARFAIRLRGTGAAAPDLRDLDAERQMHLIAA